MPNRRNDVDDLGVSRPPVISFKTPTPPSMRRRVVGLPGDRIEIRDRQVFRNGKPIEEPYK
jgi:signal peptidase I